MGSWTVTWVDLLVALPFVLLFLVWLFHVGHLKGRLDHVLEHGHHVPIVVPAAVVAKTEPKLAVPGEIVVDQKV